jgi:hypothetical protein
MSLATAPARRGASLFASRPFLLLWAVGGLANVSRWLEPLAAALYVLEVTRSQLAVAVVLASRSLPLLFLGAVGGVLAEALDRRLLLLLGMLLSAAAAGAIAVLAWGGEVQLWQLCLAGLASGLVYGSDMPVRRRMVGEAVAAAQLGRAVALDSLTASASRIAGPLLGGLGYAVLGLGGSFAVSAGFNLLGAACVLFVRERQVTRSVSFAGVFTDLAEALALLRTAPVLRALMLVTMAQNLFGFAYTSVVAPLGREVFGVSDVLTGVLGASEPAGGAVGGLLLALFGSPPGRPVWLLIGGSAGFLAAMGLVPALPFFWPACALLFAAGLLLCVYVNEQTTIALNETPAAMRSRVMGLLTVAIGMWPLGQMLAGWLAERVGALAALGVLGAAGLLWLVLASVLYLRARARAG